MCEKVAMAEKRKLEFDSLSGVSEAESADIHGNILGQVDNMSTVTVLPMR